MKTTTSRNGKGDDGSPKARAANTLTSHNRNNGNENDNSSDVVTSAVDGIIIQVEAETDVEQAVLIQEEEDNIPPSGEEKQQEIHGFSALIKERKTSASGLNYDTTKGSRRASSGGVVALINQKRMDNDILGTQAKQDKNEELDILKLKLESRMRLEREEMESRMKEELETRVRQVVQKEMEAKVEAMVNILLEGKAKHGMMNQPTPGKFLPLETYNNSSNNKNDNQFPVTYCHQQGCLIVSPSHLCFLSDDGCISMDWEWNSLGRITTNRIMRIQRPDGKKISLLFEFESQVALLAAAAQFRRHISKARAATTGSIETPRRSSDSEYAMERKGLLQRGTDVKYSAMSLDRYPSDHTPNDSEVVCLLHQNNNNVACLLRRLEKLEEMEASRDARAEKIVRDILEKERAGGAGNSPNPPVPPREGAESPRSNGAYNDTVTRQEVMEFEMFNRRLKEIEKHVGIDAGFCLLPVRPIGQSSAGVREITVEQAGRPFKLGKDLYSILACWGWKTTPFRMSLVSVFVFQIVMWVLLLVDRLDGSDKENPLLLPANVEWTVHVAQFLTVIVAILSQDDLLGGIEGFLQGEPDNFRGEDCFQRINKLQWRLAYAIRFLQGFMGMFTSYVLLMQAESVIDLLLDFLGVTFISHLDDQFFALAALGYLGNTNMKCTQAISRAEFYRKESKNSTGKRCSAPSWFKDHIHVVGVFTVLVTMLSYYTVLLYQQSAGNYSVGSLLVEFGDETVPYLGLFNGCYKAEDFGKHTVGRIVYSIFSQQGTRATGGTFGFCSEMNRWMFYDNAVGDKCRDYIIKSEETRTFDILEAGNDLQWYTENDLPLEFFKISEDQCDGKSMPLIPPDACKEIELSVDGTLHESISRFFSMLESSTQDAVLQDPTLSHGVYVGKEHLEVLLFTGRRWVITDAEQLSESTNSNLTSISDIQKFFFVDDLFRVKEQHKNWILFISEEVKAVNDQGTPLGLRWYHPRNDESYGYNFSSIDLSRPNDAVFVCALCHSDSNPCLYGGICQEDGSCACANGASGELCREKPLGNGECNPYFNKAAFDFDGGDCCGSTCTGGQCGTTSGFDLFGLENITVNPWVGDWFGSYVTDMGIVATSGHANRYNCRDPEMATFTIEFSLLEKGWSDGINVACTFGSLSVRCGGKSYLQTPAVVFPDNYHCLQSYVESVHVPHGTNCELRLMDPSQTAHYGYEYDIAFYYGDGTNSAAIQQQRREMDSEKGTWSWVGTWTWDVPISQCLTEVLSNTTLDIFDGLSAPGSAIERLSSDGLSDYQCKEDAGMVKERYFLTLLNQSVSLPSKAWDLHQCQGWGFPAVRIECNKNNTRIMSLRTSNIQKPVGGTLPTEVTFLSHLEYMHLFSENLNGTIPTELGYLENLTELSLWGNDFKGPIPSQLSQLTALTLLHLYRNALTRTIPSQLGHLTTLDNFGLGSNDLTGSIPTEMGQLTALVGWLSFDGNALTGSIPKELGEMTNLKYLDLYRNALSGPIASELVEMTSLLRLSLWSNSLSGSLPSELAQMTNLENLLLENNTLTGTIPLELESLVKNGSLTALTLSNNSLSGTIPEGLCSLGLFYSKGWTTKGLSFDCNDQLCGCCWCPCPGKSTYDYSTCDGDWLSQNIPSVP